MPATTRTKKPTAKPRAPRRPKVAEVNMIDTAEEIIKDDEEGRVKPPRAQKAGPKKVLNETSKAIADAGAVGLVAVTTNPKGKHLLVFQEAQSITHPVTRMIGRRLPGWLKRFAPNIKVGGNPEDAADIEEILVTFGRVLLRLSMEMITEFVENKEKTRAEKQRKQATGEAPPAHRPTIFDYEQPPATVQHSVPPSEEDAPVLVGTSSNGHNPAFNVIGSDFGLEV